MIMIELVRQATIPLDLNKEGVKEVAIVTDNPWLPPDVVCQMSRADPNFYLLVEKMALKMPNPKPLSRYSNYRVSM